MKKIIVFNTGSSTIKYKLFEFDKDHNLFVIKEGAVDRIGLPNGPKNHTVALSLIFKGISESFNGLSGIPDLVAIGHRVVHCGDQYQKTTLLNNEVLSSLKEYDLLAPLHNPKIMTVIDDIMQNSGRDGHREIPNYAVFDSVFFKDLPKVSKLYPLSYELYEKYGIEKFGFHGISHQYITESVLKRHKNAKKIISIHLGSGSSITAIANGNHPIDTSMGMTPLDGLMMLTRPGELDPGVIDYILQKHIVSPDRLKELLNMQSGLVGFTGVDTDMMDFLNIAGYKVEDVKYKPKIDPKTLDKNTIERVKLGIEMYIYRIKKYIGSYYAILGGLDVLAFTGKIGFGSSVVRDKILEGLEHITRNSIIEAIETEEEYQIAKEILKVIDNG